jgi:hypothetical protein
MFRKISVALSIFSALLLVCAISSRADQVSHARIVRLSFVEGDVAYQMSAGSTWQRAMMNLPIQQNFSLRTDAGYAEVEFESGLVIRLARNTQVEFADLSLIDGRKVTSLKLDSGTIIATCDVAKTDQFTVSSGNMEITAPKNGRFRVDANSGQNWVTVFHGKVDVADGAKTQVVDSGNTLHDGGDADGVSTAKNSTEDAFDKWVTQRDQAQMNSQSAASDIVSAKNYPSTVSDLYDYGLWYNVPGYGMAWQPYGVGAGWMPFSAGEWMFMNGGFDMGWNWISDEPWGWMPYHYGAWFDVPGEGWFWSPENMGAFMPGNASFVNVGGVTGWTPVLANPTNPNKVRPAPGSPIHVVLAGTAGNGVINAGMRGQVNAGMINRTAGLAANYSQSTAPSVLHMMSAGVNVTALAPRSAMNRSFGPVGESNVSAGMAGRPIGGAPLGGRPAMLAPHTSAVAVPRAPSTFARYSGPSSSGIRPVGGGSSGGFSAARGSFGPSGSSAGSAHSSGPAMGSAGAAGHASGGSSGGSAGAKH